MSPSTCGIAARIAVPLPPLGLRSTTRRRALAQRASDRAGVVGRAVVDHDRPACRARARRPARAPPRSSPPRCRPASTATPRGSPWRCCCGRWRARARRSWRAWKRGGCSRPVPCHAVRAFPEVSGVRHEFVDLRTGVRMHVAQAGPPDAPPLLLLHGWPQHWYLWRRRHPAAGRPLPAGLPRQPRLRLERAGAGRRLPQAAPGRRPRSPLLDALGIERAGLIGHDCAAGRLVCSASTSWRSALAAILALHAVPSRCSRGGACW